MVSNLTGNGASSDHFAWGRDAWTYDEARSFGDPSQAPELSKSWLNYTATSFNNVKAGQRFQIGTLDYFNGSIVGGSAADKVTFTADLDFKMNGVNATKSLDFDFERVNTINRLDPKDPWPMQTLCDPPIPSRTKHAASAASTSASNLSSARPLRTASASLTNSISSRGAMPQRDSAGLSSKPGHSTSTTDLPTLEIFDRAV